MDPCCSYVTVLVVLVASASFLLVLLSLPRASTLVDTIELRPDRCASRYVYIHDLPPRFNAELLRDCRTLNAWTDMCPFVANSGLGQPLADRAFFRGDAWYGTHQFALDVVFHECVKSYECLTADASKASAVFVPYYAGLDVGRYLWGPHNTSVRDGYGEDLAQWLRARPEWSVMGGQDHFMVAGRVTWDFQRPSDEESAWGNRLLLLPEVRNMTTLVLETNPRRGCGGDGNHADVAIPYPTYFHPQTNADMLTWQRRVLQVKRRWLFSFAGAPRAVAGGARTTRDAAMEQCRRSRRCKLLDCVGEAARRCHDPTSVMKVFGDSSFCLQPPGDTFTRRSTFDSMVAGCIPVFFTNESASEQYIWHLGSIPPSTYSVVIAEARLRERSVKVEEVLRRISKKDVRAMREAVVAMMPRLIYRDPGGEGVRDAFDVTLEGVLRRVERRRKEMRRSGGSSSSCY